MAWEYQMLVVQAIAPLELYPISCMVNLAITWMFVLLVFNKQSRKIHQK